MQDWSAAAYPPRLRVGAGQLGGALGAWGRFSGVDGRESDPGGWIRADGELLRARWDRTELDLLSVDARRFAVRRSAEYTARTATTRHIVVVQLAGHSLLRPADGRPPVALGPGELSYGDPSVPYSWEFDGPMTVMMLRLPHAALALAPAVLRPILGSPFAADAGYARLAVGFARDVLSDETLLSGPSAPQILRNAVAHFDTLLADRLRLAEHHDPGDPAFQRALAHISANLRGTLSPRSVAEATGMSARTLQAMFQRHGMTVSSWVRQRRLEAAREALAGTARADVDITRIALDHGFSDHSHFTRSFRAAYGETPSAWRERSTRQRMADRFRSGFSF